MCNGQSVMSHKAEKNGGFSFSWVLAFRGSTSGRSLTGSDRVFRAVDLGEQVAVEL